MKYQLVIFDSDGTLADTLPWMRSMYGEVAVTHGLATVNPEDEPRIRKLHGRELLKALKLPLWKLPRVTRDMQARMTAHAGGFSLFAGIADALQRLVDCGMKLAIVSSNSRLNVERVLGPETSRLISHFDCGAAMFGKASKLRRVIRKSGAERVIYVGDEVRDGEAARAAGVAFGAVVWGHHDAEMLSEQLPAEIFHTPAEIAEKLC